MSDVSLKPIWKPLWHWLILYWYLYISIKLYNLSVNMRSGNSGNDLSYLTIFRHYYKKKSNIFKYKKKAPLPCNVILLLHRGFKIEVLYTTDWLVRRNFFIRELTSVVFMIAFLLAVNLKWVLDLEFSVSFIGTS